MFGLSEREIRVCRHLVRAMIFEPCATLVGRRFEANAVADFMAPTEPLAITHLAPHLKTSSENIEATLIKYEFADLRFSLARPPADLGPAGSKVLSSLLVDDDPSAQSESKTEADERFGFLEDLLAEVQEGELELAVLCETEGLEVNERQKVTRQWQELPPGFFPREFEVTDAYITNAPTISIFRNFYL